MSADCRSLLSVLSVLLALLLPAATALADGTQVLVAHGLVTAAQGRGADLFFRETFSGNGRTWGSCHQVGKNLEIDTDFIAQLPPGDPLFVAEFPPSQGGVPDLEKPALMRSHALILENRDGFSDPTSIFVMRGVPHSLSMGTSVTPPNDGRPQGERTGWGGDAGTVRDFPTGAVTQHFTKTLNRVAGVDFVLPTSSQLDDMEQFMLGSGRLDDLNLPAVSLTDSEAEAGRVLFLDNSVAKCNTCHHNAGANSAFGGNANFNTGVEQLVNPARAIENFPFDAGFGLDPFDTDGDGEPDSFGDGTFNVAPLVEAADTGPFFHNNVIETIEEAVAFYSGPEFNNSPAGALVGGIDLTDAQSQEIAAFLRVINAGFNLDIAIQRTDAGETLENSSGGHCHLCPTQQSPDGEPTGSRQTVDAELALANIEATDAFNDLDQRGLNPTAVSLLLEGIDFNNQAIQENSSNQRKLLIQKALDKFTAAKADLGSGLTLSLGKANLLF